MAMSLHLYVISTQVPEVPEELPLRGGAGAHLHGPGHECPLHRIPGVPAGEEEVVERGGSPENPGREPCWRPSAWTETAAGRSWRSENLTLGLRREDRPPGRELPGKGEGDLRHHRPRQQREDQLPPDPQPDERVRPRDEGGGKGPLRRRGRQHLQERLCPSAQNRGRLPPSGGAPPEHLRQRRPCAPDWLGSGRRSELDEIVERCLTAGGPLGRGEGPPPRPG